MKKILFIIQSYPSERSANVLCDEKIMKELLKTGEYEIHALTYQYEWQKREDTINGFHIHRFKKSIFWDLFTWGKHHPDHYAARIIDVFHRINMRIKQVVTIPCYPCYEPINSLLYARAAIKLYKKYKFDLIIAEHHGFDSLYAGHRVKSYAQEETRLIPILWDPITGAQPAKYLPESYARKKTAKAEERMLSNADRIIAMHSIEAYLRTVSTNKTYFDRYRFFDIPGIVPPAIRNLKQSEFIDPEMINLLYAGLLYLPDRDPSFLIELVNQSEWPKNVNMIFLCTGNGADVALEKAKTFKGKITVHSYVKREELQQIMSTVDGFLNIGSNNPGMVPSKIFEYMSYGKPIISSYIDPKDASREYLQKYPLGICLDINADIQENISRLNAFVHDNISKRLSFDEVSALFTDNTPEPYVNLIREVLSDKE